MDGSNNLVVELLSVPGDSARADVEYRFANPREGWVFISVAGHGDWHVILDDRRVMNREGTGETTEVMRWLSEGHHTVRVLAEKPRRLGHLVIRAVPELAFCKYQYDPHVPQYGPYDWEFLRRHILPHVNLVVGSGTPEHDEHVAWWKERGGKWIIEGPLPGVSAQTISADEAYDAWVENPGFSNRLADGAMADEFFAGTNPKYRAWTEAVGRLAANEKLRGKRLYPYLGSHWPDRSDWYEGEGNEGPDSSKRFLRTVLDAGYVIAWERYLQERHEAALAEEYIEQRLGETMKHWLSVFPDCAKQLLVCLGYMTITESLDIHPSVDYKVFMDMQFHFLANRPQFAELFGILEYTSGYADEETVRWAARLCRHYGIEGNKDLLSDRYGFTYKLDHIWNPDFAHGLEGWTIPIWIEKNVAVKSFDRYSHLQGRWPRTSVGDTFFTCKRSAERANAISQPIRNLNPGKLYSVKLISGDYGDLVNGRSAQREHVLSITVEGGDILPDRTFRSVVPNNYAHQLDPFAGDNKYWFNYHQTVFRAKGPAARLTISDWAGPSEPGGPIGQELLYNFVEVQPYFEG